MLTSFSSREQSGKSVHISTLWSGRVDCPHVRQDQHQPRTLVPPVLPKEHSLLGWEELHCPGGAHAPRQPPSDDVSDGVTVSSLDTQRAQPLAFWGLKATTQTGVLRGATNL